MCYISVLQLYLVASVSIILQQNVILVQQMKSIRRLTQFNINEAIKSEVDKTFFAPFDFMKFCTLTTFKGKSMFVKV